MRAILILSLLLGAISCKQLRKEENTKDLNTEQPPQRIVAMKPAGFDTQGHRGCRGLLPENSMPAFIKALDLGVVTLELDLVISGDEQVVVSHDPWFSHLICADTEGNAIGKTEEKSLRIFSMSYDAIKTYDCGSRQHPGFPEQRPLRTHKPLLSEVIEAADKHAIATGRELPFYNVETKCTPAGDGTLHPSPEAFAMLAMRVLLENQVAERSIIQSFDPRTLQFVHENFPGMRLALLVENDLSLEENIERLGFVPDIYSPEYTLITPEMPKVCRQKGMQLIPWTVNDIDEMKTLKDMGVDGIISDYPNRFGDL